MTLLGRFPALAGVDLDISPGEIVLLKGPNGAGKTTLLRLCAGLSPLASGQGWVLGHDLSCERRVVRRRVALLGHRTGLYDDLTVAENMAFWARATGAGRQEVDAALEQLSLTGRVVATRVGRLSAGQRRRVSIASLVVRRPELWLLDEPHAGLDQQSRATVDRLVHEAAVAGATVVMASHELDRIRLLEPRVVSLAGGRVCAGDGLVGSGVCAEDGLAGGRVGAGDDRVGGRMCAEDGLAGGGVCVGDDRAGSGGAVGSGVVEGERRGS